MAKGFDELLEYVLGEIALCGDEGATIADFRRFIQEFYAQPDTDPASRKFGTREIPTVVPDQRLFEKVWGWVNRCPDFVVEEEQRGRSLGEIEAGEKELEPQEELGDEENGSGNVVGPEIITGSGNAAEPEAAAPSENDQTKTDASTNPRESLGSSPKPPTNGFRMHASEERVWKAITGHGIDYKKIPVLEFQCLKVICSRGKRGIVQPELTAATGQDKRSTPKRTDNLAEKGYIEKKAVNIKGMRTTLCTHRRFITKKAVTSQSDSNSKDAASESGNFVFIDGKLIMDNLITYLYDLLKDVRIVSQVDLRKKLNVPSVKDWKGKALEGALARLKSIEYIGRTKARVQGHPTRTALCVKLLRAPTEDDRRSLGFSGLGRAAAETILEEDQEGDDDLRDLDLEADLVYEDEVEEIDRIPPQWTPDRPITNYIFEAIDAAGVRGTNSLDLRLSVLGKFWKRPLENTLVRLTDTWEKNQPFYLRHFTVIRDTAITQERKFIHYIFRSYGNFQKAVDAGETEWAAVQDPKKTINKKNAKEKTPIEPEENQLDEWGFPILSANGFTNNTGAATLQECRESMNEVVMSNHWDNSLIEKMGYRKVKAPRPKAEKKPPVRKKTKFGYGDPIAIKIPKMFQKPSVPGQAAARNGVVGNGTPRGASDSADVMEIDTPTRVPPPHGSEPISIAPFIGKTKATTPRASSNTSYLDIDGLREWRIANGYKVQGRLTIEARKILEEQGLIPPTTPHPKKAPKTPKVSKTSKVPKTTKKGRKSSERSSENPATPLETGGFQATPLSINSELGGPTPALIENDQSSQLQTQLLEASQAQTTLTEPEQLLHSQGGVTSAELVPPRLDKTNINGQMPDSGLPSVELHGVLVEQSWPLPENHAPAILNTAEATEERPPKRSAVLMDITRTVDSDSGRPRKKARKVTSDKARTTVDPSSEPGERVNRILAEDRQVQSTSPSRIRKKYKSWKIIAEESFDRNSQENASIGPGAGQDSTALESQSTTSPAVATIEGIDNDNADLQTLIPATEQGVANALSSQPSSTDTPALNTLNRPSAAWAINENDLDPHVAAILERFNGRSTPGIYINPFATRRIARGRPRRALIAVFKSDRLSELGLPLDPPLRLLPPKTGVRAQQVAGHSGEGSFRRRGVGTVRGWNRRKPLTREDPSKHQQDTSQTDRNGLETIEDTGEVTQIASPNGITSPTSLKRKSSAGQTLEGHMDKRQRISDEHDDSRIEQIQHSPTDIDVEDETMLGTTDQHQSELLDMDSNDVTTVTQDEPVVPENPTVLPEDPSQDIEPGRANSPPISPTASAPTDPQFIDVPDAEIAEVAECSQAPVKKRGVIIGGGSVFYKRNRIIVDIITRCGGVFPGNNELYYVFMAAWERATNLKTSRRPDRATITKQVKMLISDGTLQRLQFSFQSTRGKLVSKEILTLTHIDPLSSEVKSLQKHMILTHPNLYYPDEVSDLATEIRAKGPHRRFDIETELIVEPMFPVTQRLEERVKKTKEERESEKKEKRAAYMRERTAKKRAERMRELLLSAANGTGNALALGGIPRNRPIRLPKLHSNGPQQYAMLLPGVEGQVVLISSESSEEDNESETHRSENDMDELDGDALDDTPSPIFLDELDEDFSDSDVEEGQTSRGMLYRAMSDPEVTFYPNIGIFATHAFTQQRSSRTRHSTSQERTTHHASATLAGPHSIFHPPTGTFSTKFNLPVSVLNSTKFNRLPLPQSLDDIVSQSLPRWKGAVDRNDKHWLVVPEHNMFFQDVYSVASWEIRHSWLVQRSSLPIPNDTCFINHCLHIQHTVANSQNVERDNDVNRNENRRGPYSKANKTPGRNWISYDISPDKGRLVPSAQRSLDVDGVEDSSTKKRRVHFDLDGEELQIPRNKGGRPRKYAIGEPRPKRVYTKRPKQNISADSTSEPTTSNAAPPKQKRIRKKADSNPTDSAQPKIKRGRRRRALTRCIIDNEATDKLLYTVVVAKVLAGGVEQTIDWKVVAKVFAGHPNFDMDTFRKRWIAISHRCRALIDRLTEQFQQHFIEAFERGDAPNVNLDDPESYDWVELVSWARTTLKASSRSILLPLDRAEIEKDFIVEEVPKHTDFHNHWHDGTMQAYIRQQEVANYVYSVPLEKSNVPRVDEPTADPELLRAKSWLRTSVANAAPNDSDSERLALEKLGRLGEAYIDEALSSLRVDGAFKVLKKGRNPLLGDDFTLSPTFYKEFKRVWDVENFRDAVLFKQEMDRVFSTPTETSSTNQDGDITMSGTEEENTTTAPSPPASSMTLNPDSRLPLSITASDGALMVIITLLSNSRVKLVPHLPAINSNLDAPFPRLSIWGWTQGNYRAVSSPRNHIFWDLDLVPTSTYRFGNPLAEDKGFGTAWDVAIKPPPVYRGVDIERRIPLWNDLEERFVYPWWERAVVAVLQLIVLRAPSSVAAVSKSLAKVMERWEVELVIRWLLDVGACRVENERVLPGEWWWCVLGDTELGRAEAAKRKAVRDTALAEPGKKPGVKPGYRKPRPLVSGMNIGYPILVEDDGEHDDALLELAGANGDGSGHESGGEENGVEDGGDGSSGEESADEGEEAEIGDNVDEGEGVAVEEDGDVVMEG